MCCRIQYLHVSGHIQIKYESVQSVLVKRIKRKMSTTASFERAEDAGDKEQQDHNLAVMSSSEMMSRAKTRLEDTYF